MDGRVVTGRYTRQAVLSKVIRASHVYLMLISAFLMLRPSSIEPSSGACLLGSAVETCGQTIRKFQHKFSLSSYIMSAVMWKCLHHAQLAGGWWMVDGGWWMVDGNVIHDHTQSGLQLTLSKLLKSRCPGMSQVFAEFMGAINMS